MKKIITTLLLCFSISFANDYLAFAKKMNYETDYKIALQKASQQNKDIMLVMVANFCPWCVKLEKLVLQKPSNDFKIKSKYIPLIINREEANFPKQFDTPIVPTVYFIDYKNQTIKNKIVGYNNKLDLINIISE